MVSAQLKTECTYHDFIIEPLLFVALIQKGKGLVNCVYKPCPAALYSVVQSHCSILSSYMTVWVAIAVFENGES